MEGGPQFIALHALTHRPKYKKYKAGVARPKKSNREREREREEEGEGGEREESQADEEGAAPHILSSRLSSPSPTPPSMMDPRLTRAFCTTSSTAAPSS